MTPRREVVVQQLVSIEFTVVTAQSAAIMTSDAQSQHDAIAHVQLLLDSYRHWTGRELLGSAVRGAAAVRQLFEAPFVVVSHDTAPDPVFNYGNAAALALFEMSLAQFLATPSRASAEPILQADRARLMARVTAQGFVDDYTGVRISRTGRRFHIPRATVWNLRDAAGAYAGQAATFTAWEYI